MAPTCNFKLFVHVKKHRSAKKFCSSRVVIVTNVLDTYNKARRVETASLLELRKWCL